MTEFKTLKDFEEKWSLYDGNDSESLNLLRQEGIKWAKREIEGMKTSEDWKKILNHIGRFQVLCEIFNIKEEDLK